MVSAVEVLDEERGEEGAINTVPMALADRLYQEHAEVVRITLQMDKVRACVCVCVCVCVCRLHRKNVGSRARSAGGPMLHVTAICRMRPMLLVYEALSC